MVKKVLLLMMVLILLVIPAYANNITDENMVVVEPNSSYFNIDSGLPEISIITSCVFDPDNCPSIELAEQSKMYFLITCSIILVILLKKSGVF